MTHSLFAVFAHPDDEAFATGATLAHYAAHGTQATLVCTTNGDVGEIADPALATPDTLWQVRQDELRCASGLLGVHDLVFLNYRDSGMAGTPENDDPRAFANAPAEEVVGRLVGLIRRRQPQVVVTFDPSGGYGHPDHLAAHRHTVAAFHAAGDPAQYPAAGQPWPPARLFYAVTPRSFWQQMVEQMKAAGEDVSGWERDPEEAWGWPDEQVTVALTLPDTVEAKLAALACHATQFGPDNPFRKLPEQTVRELMSHEYFALAWPEPTGRLADLFEGLV
jgi:N-acetyl-1-D-myo-inositol-2-amino-2-deoxy-alpha-D-glucopyranoside deacetylase